MHGKLISHGALKKENCYKSRKATKKIFKKKRAHCLMSENNLKHSIYYFTSDI